MKQYLSPTLRFLLFIFCLLTAEKVTHAQITQTAFHANAPLNNDGYILTNIPYTGAPYTFNWSNGETTKNIYQLSPGTYTLTLTNAQQVQSIHTSLIGTASNNYAFPWIPQTGSSSQTIAIPVDSVSLYGQPLMNGDLIGAFYDSLGRWACAGYITWNGTAQNMIISGDPSGISGFSPGDSIRLLIRSQASGMDHLASINWDTTAIYNSSGEFQAGSQSQIISIHANNLVLQTIYVYPGNNDITLWVDPLFTHPADVFYQGLFSWLTRKSDLLYYWLQFGLGLFQTIEIGTPYQITSYYESRYSIPGFLQDTIIASISNNLCHDIVDGSIHLQPFFGQAPYTYLWDNGATSNPLTNILPYTEYSVTVSDNQNDTMSLTINSLPGSGPPLISISSLAPTGGAANGSITINSSGNFWGSPSYIWSSGQSGSGLSNLSSGTYSVTIQNYFGCIIDTSYYLDGSLQAIPHTQQISCFGETDGSAWFTLGGGYPPYAVDWSNGATGDSISSLSAGYYTATVSDTNLDSLVFSFHIISPSAMQVSANIIPDFVPAANGEIHLTVNGGTAPYTFAWSNGNTNQNLATAASGDYQVSISDANNCLHISNYHLGGQSSGSGGMQTQWTYQNPHCANPCDGLINVSLNSVSGAINYLWSNGATTQDLMEVCAGTYTLTLTHPGVNPVNLPTPWNYTNTGQNHSVMIPAGSLFINGMAAVDTFLIGVFYNDGGQLECGGMLSYENSSTAFPVWGDDSYTTDKDGFSMGEPFSWFIYYDNQVYPLSVSYDSTADPGQYGSNLLSEITAMHLDIAFGDTIEVSLQIQSPLNLSYSVVPSDPLTGIGGAIDVSVTGGVSPYTYLWSNGSISQDLSNLSYGIYTLTLMDQTGCYVSQNIQVGYSYSPDPISAIIVPSGIACFGECNGDIELQVNFAPQPATIEWSTGGSGYQIDSLCPGSYSVTITSPIDTLILTTLIFQPDTFTVQWNTIAVDPQDGFDGQIELLPSGGTIPYGIQWSQGDTTLLISDLSIGNYSFTLSDANGCTLADSINLGFASQFLTIAISVQQLTCAGDTNAWASVDVLAGLTPLTFSWSNGESGDSIANLSAGTYTLTVSSFSGETQVHSFEISALDTLNLTHSVQGVDPATNAPGSIQLTLSGGLAPYTYLWSDGSNGSQLPGLDLGSYELTVSDAAGCMIMDTIQVDFSVLPNWNLQVLPIQIHNFIFDDDTRVNYNGTTALPMNTFLGAFYDSSGTAACGGYMVYRGNPGIISVYGGGTFTPGDEIEWRIWNPISQQTLSIFAAYDAGYPNDGLYFPGGSSRLDSLQSVCISGVTQSVLQNPAGEGIATAYLQSSDRFIQSTEKAFQQGQFMLDGLKPGRYLVHIQPDGQDLLPVYASDQSRWIEANTVSAFGYTGGIVVNLSPAQDCVGDCIGKISGAIQVAGWQNQSQKIQTSSDSENSSKGMGIPNILILLYQNQKAIQSTRSDENGQFTFSHLALGDYELWVEIPGYSGEFYPVSLTASNSDHNNLLFTIIDGEILLKPELNQANFQLFPNPAQNEIYLSFNSDTKLKSCKLFTADGRELTLSTRNLNPANYSDPFITLNISHLQAGIYFLQIQTADAISSFKLIKE